MACVYILYSKSVDRYYVGSCLNLSERIWQHQNKYFKGSYTSRADDWKVYLVIDQLAYPAARSVESHIKRMKSRQYIEELRGDMNKVEGLRARFGGK